MTETEVQIAPVELVPDGSITANIAVIEDEKEPLDVNSPSNSPAADSDDAEPDPIMAFAMLRFTDGKYFMKTMSLLIGRDMVAYRAALLDTNAWALRNIADGEEPTFIYEVLDQPVNQNSLSNGSSAGKSPHANGSDSADSPPDVDHPLTVEVPNDTGKHECPFLAIHQPKQFGEILPSGSSISRRHAKIEFNSGTGHFDIYVLGKNGLFLNHEYLPIGERLQLKHRDHVQIAAIEFDFFLPSGADESDNEEAGPDSVSGRMSFAFENENGEQVEVEVESGDDGWNHADNYAYNEYYYSSSSNEDEDDGSQDGEQVDDEDDEEEEEDDGENEDRDLEDNTELDVAEDEEGEEDEEEGEQEDDESDEAERPKLKAPARLKITLKRGPKAKAARKRLKEQVASKPKAVKGGKRPAKTFKKAEKANGKQVTKSKEKALAKERPEAEKEDGDEKKDAAPVARIVRDEPLQNGDGVEVVGLPIGVTIPARRKGPGRPPKDGIMSKRERQLLIRQWREQEKAKKLGLDPSTVVLPEPKKPGRARKNSQGEDVFDTGENGVKDGDDQERKRVIRPPRSPSPQMREEDYNEEQLARPAGNYVIFIWEAIMASAEKRLNLQQIYSAIERKYPYFKFRVNTPGWQSSVRHNLGQHPAFEKVEKDGKGYLWGIKDGVPIDRERKKRSPPPPTHPYASYPAPQYGQMPNGAVPQSYGLHAHHNPPPRQPLVPPSLAHTTSNRPTSYSSPYATANQRPAAIGSHHPPYSHPLPDATSASKPPTYQQQVYYPPIQRPSQDVIETFVSVFKKSFQDNNKAIDMATADRIVNNAVKRVLEPHTMANVPSEESEHSVVDAFRRCLERSQGPPRQAVPAMTPLAAMATAVGASALKAEAIARSTPPIGLGISSHAPNSASFVRSTTPPDPVRPSSIALPTVQARAVQGPAQTDGRISPQRPAVEPLTPPTVQTRTSTPVSFPKRTINEVDEPEVPDNKRPNGERAAIKV